jgi:DNA-binding MarR family transcriptional regulator
VDTEARREALQDYVEQMGLMFSAWGLPRMAGRILGWLLVCHPPRQSAAELAAQLGASKGSISTNIRLLLQSGFVEKTAVAGERATHYRLAANPVDKMMQLKVESLAAMRRMAERGLKLVAGGSPEQRQRIEMLRDMWAFFERELPRLAARYARERSGGAGLEPAGGGPDRRGET